MSLAPYVWISVMVIGSAVAVGWAAYRNHESLLSAYLGLVTVLAASIALTLLCLLIIYGIKEIT